MADNTKIEWTDATWNPLRGCTRVSEGCRNCYAEVMAARFSDSGQWGHGLAQRVKLPGGGTDHRWTGKVVLAEGQLDQPLRWRKPRRIFVNSTSDLFHESVPDEWIDRVFAVMALAPHHTFQVLTKRPERARVYLSGDGDTTLRRLATALTPGSMPISKSEIIGRLHPDYSGAWRNPRTPWPLPNVWLGTSVEDQATADARIPHLLATPAAVRFLSCEPLLGQVDLTNVPKRKIANNITILHNALDGIDGLGNRSSCLDWVICGGESGPGARPMHPDWARSLRDQCVAAGVPFFFKQWGEWGPAHSAIPYDHLPEDWDFLLRVGKKATGRLLDGRTWDQFPGGKDRADG